MSIKKSIGIGIRFSPFPVTEKFVQTMSDMVYEEPFTVSENGLYACKNWRHIPTGLLLVHRIKGTYIPIDSRVGMCDEWFLMSNNKKCCAHLTSIGKMYAYLDGTDNFFEKDLF